MSAATVTAILVVFSVLYIIIMCVLAYMVHRKQPAAKAPPRCTYCSDADGGCIICNGH